MPPSLPLSPNSSIGGPATVRPATPDDLSGLALLFDAYRQFYRQPADPAGAAVFLAERMSRGESRVLVATCCREPGNLLGFCQLYPSFCSVAARRIEVLSDLFVSPAARRNGTGRALLLAAHAQAVAAGVHRLDLSTARDNVAAQALYESLGWVRDEVYLTYTLAAASG